MASSPLRKRSPSPTTRPRSATPVRPPTTVLCVRKVANVKFGAVPVVNALLPGTSIEIPPVSFGTKLKDVFVHSKSSIAFVHFHSENAATDFLHKVIQMFSHTYPKIERDIFYCDELTIDKLKSGRYIDGMDHKNVEDDTTWYLELCDPIRVGGGYSMQWSLVHRKPRSKQEDLQIKVNQIEELQKELAALKKDNNKWQKQFAANEAHQKALAMCHIHLQTLVTRVEQHGENPEFAALKAEAEALRAKNKDLQDEVLRLQQQNDKLIDTQHLMVEQAESLRRELIQNEAETIHLKMTVETLRRQLRDAALFSAPTSPPHPSPAPPPIEPVPAPPNNEPMNRVLQHVMQEFSDSIISQLERLREQMVDKHVVTTSLEKITKDLAKLLSEAHVRPIGPGPLPLHSEADVGLQATINLVKQAINEIRVEGFHTSEDLQLTLNNFQETFIEKLQPILVKHVSLDEKHIHQIVSALEKLTVIHPSGGTGSTDHAHIEKLMNGLQSTIVAEIGKLHQHPSLDQPNQTLADVLTTKLHTMVKASLAEVQFSISNHFTESLARLEMKDDLTLQDGQLTQLAQNIWQKLEPRFGGHIVVEGEEVVITLSETLKKLVSVTVMAELKAWWAEMHPPDPSGAQRFDDARDQVEWLRTQIESLLTKLQTIVLPPSTPNTSGIAATPVSSAPRKIDAMVQTEESSMARTAFLPNLDLLLNSASSEWWHFAPHTTTVTSQHRHNLEIVQQDVTALRKEVQSFLEEVLVLKGDMADKKTLAKTSETVLHELKTSLQQFQGKMSEQFQGVTVGLNTGQLRAEVDLLQMKANLQQTVNGSLGEVSKMQSEAASRSSMLEQRVKMFETQLSDMLSFLKEVHGEQTSVLSETQKTMEGLLLSFSRLEASRMTECDCPCHDPATKESLSRRHRRFLNNSNNGASAIVPTMLVNAQPQDPLRCPPPPSVGAGGGGYRGAESSHSAGVEAIHFTSKSLAHVVNCKHCWRLLERGKLHRLKPKDLADLRSNESRIATGQPHAGHSGKTFTLCGHPDTSSILDVSAVTTDGALSPLHISELPERGQKPTNEEAQLWRCPFFACGCDAVFASQDAFHEHMSQNQRQHAILLASLSVTPPPQFPQPISNPPTPAQPPAAAPSPPAALPQVESHATPHPHNSVSQALPSSAAPVVSAVLVQPSRSLPAAPPPQLLPAVASRTHEGVVSP